MTSAVVFAYHDVGVRCLNVLLAQGVTVRHVYTHTDDPNENIWFGSVAAVAQQHGLPVTHVTDASQPGLMASVAATQAEYLFSFYYRYMLPPAVLALASRGALNLHGSLLPKYRGRVPVNWAIIHGEHETGATLHEMAAKPDAGCIIDQQAVPILPNDLAIDVFRKVTVAAELVLHRALPHLLNGTAVRTPQDLAAGSYYGGRKPEHGRIDWSWSAVRIHNLIRAVAPPYPGAFAMIDNHRLQILHTLNVQQCSPATGAAALFSDNNQLYLRCSDGGILQVLRATIDEQELTAQSLQTHLGTSHFNFTH